MLPGVGVTECGKRLRCLFTQGIHINAGAEIGVASTKAVCRASLRLCEEYQGHVLALTECSLLRNALR